MTATATRRADLPALDADAEAASATERANRALKAAREAKGSDDRAVAQFASDLVVNAEKQIKERSAYRDKLMLSLVVRGGYPAAQVAKAAGTSRAWIIKMLDTVLGAGDGKWTMKGIPKDPAERDALAKRKKVPFYSNAHTELPAVAAEIVKQKAVIAAAMPVRDDAARALIAAGTPRDDVAKIIGRNPSRVSHLTSQDTHPVTA